MLLMIWNLVSEWSGRAGAHRRSELERLVTKLPSGARTATAERPPRTSIDSACSVDVLMSTELTWLSDEISPAGAPHQITT